MQKPRTRGMIARCCVALAFVIAAPALAQTSAGVPRSTGKSDRTKPKADGTPLHDAIGAPDNFKLTGSFRARIEAIDGQYRPGFATSDRLLSFRTTLFAEYDAGPVRFGGELFDSRAYLAEPDTSTTTGEVNALELVQAYVGLDLEDGLGSGSTTLVTAGRMTMSVGSNRLISRQNFRNTTNAYTGVRMERTGAKGDYLTAFWVLPQIRLPFDAQGIRDNKVEWDRESDDFQLYGALYRAPLPIDGAVIEVYGYGLNERDTPRVRTANRHLFSPGIRAFRAPKTGRTDFDIELIGQRGRAHASSDPTDRTRRKVAAWFAHAEVGRRFDAAWTPRVSAVFDYATGNDRGHGIGRFDTLFGARRGEFGPTGLYGPITRSNLVSPGLRLQVQPGPDSDGFVMYRPLWLDSATDSFGLTGVRDPAGSSGRFAGQQVEFRAGHWLVPRILRLEVGYARLFKGRFLKAAPNAPSTGDTDYGYLDLSVEF